jgi:hypothetical protein
MNGYVKLFSSIVNSTIWREPNHVRIVWITMLAIADKNGTVHAALPGLADLARVTIAECEEALGTLSQPDTYSRTPDHEGRRIEWIEGGWVLLNHAKYRNMLGEAERREYLRLKKQQERETKALSVAPMSTNVNTSATGREMSTLSTHADTRYQIPVNTVADAPVRARFEKPALEAMQLYGDKIGLPRDQVEACHGHYEANGWRVGRNPMKSWQFAMLNWRRNWKEGVYSRKTNGRPTEPAASEDGARIQRIGMLREQLKTAGPATALVINQELEQLTT